MTEKQGLYDPAYEHDACGIGFVAHIHGVRSRDVVEKSLELLNNLAHRSAIAGDGCTGDGAGILLQVPHVFLRRVCGVAGISLPDAGSYGVGMLLLPSRRADRVACERIVERAVAEEGCTVLGWRDVPVEEAVLSLATRQRRPAMRQVFVSQMGVGREAGSNSAFEVLLYLIRRRIEAFQLPHQVDAGSAGQSKIDESELGALGGGRLHGLVVVGRATHLESARLECPHQPLAEPFVVVDEQERAAVARIRARGRAEIPRLSHGPSV